nr:MAG TPA: hypothetical protein [Caudoviricetes sp.]
MKKIKTIEAIEAARLIKKCAASGNAAKVASFTILKLFRLAN